MKRFLLVCLSALVSFALWADSFSAETEEGQAVYYSTISSTEVEVTGMENLSTYTGMLTIPETVYNGDTPYTVTQLGYNDASTRTGCFEKSTFYAISLPETITYIEEWTFYQNKTLTSLVFPSKVTAINDGVCSGCTALSSVTIPEGVTYIGRDAFANVSIVYLEIPNSVTTFGEQPFYGCKTLLGVKLSENLTEITASAFSGCSMLQDIEIPSSVKVIDRQAFNGCSALSEVIINEGVETINHSAFNNCTSLEEIVLPSTLTTLEYSVFNDCTALESVVLSENLTSIGYKTFSGCSSLKEISLPERIETIDYCAFQGCSALSAVYSLNTTPPTCNLSSNNETVFDGVDLETCVLYVPCDYVDAYTTASVWENFVNIQGIDCQEETGTFTCVVSPESGSEVNELYNNITFYNPTDGGAIYVNDYCDGEIEVYSEDETLVTSQAQFYPEFGPDGEDCSQTVYFEDCVSEEGTYYVIVPAELFIIYDEAGKTCYNEAMTLTYTITADSGDQESNYELVFNPDDGSKLDILSTISISCEDGITRVLMPEEEITIVDSEGNDYSYSVEEVADDDTGFVTEVDIILTTDIVDAGTYYVNVPAGYFDIGLSTNSAFTLTYTITGTLTGINGISLNSENVEGIYSTSGQRLNTMVKGVNIVRLTDGSTKKVLKK